ncbi:MAG: hypothetical protein N3F67_01370 [Acidilobaceae archaeon]|nr:hypothetical protein [Acidilobaceae archaeon]
MIIADEPERVLRDDPRSLPRIGGPITYRRHDLGMGAVLERRKQSNPLKRSAAVARRIREGRVSKKDAARVSALMLANSLAARLGLPRTASEDIGYIINAFFVNDRVSGDIGRRCLVAAATLKVIQARNLGIPRNEVLDLLGVTEDCVWKATNKLYKRGVVKELNKNVYRQGGHKRLLERVETYVSSLVNEIGIEEPSMRELVRRDSMRFVETAIKIGKNLYGKRPETIAAASVYLVARLHGYDNVNQALVAEKMKIRESNVRKIYRYLIDGMVVLVPL